MRFFLGTLLIAFMVFYFKASSGFSSFPFITALVVVLIVNELPQFLKYIGIFQDVTKPPKGEAQEFPCSYRPTSFLHHDATEFLYRENEGRVPDLAVKAYAFVAVFAPSHFNDTLTFNWEYDDPK